jgi:hypothetical protein
LVLGLSVGCTKAGVQNIREDRSVSLPRPARVIVFDFDTGAADVVVSTSPLRSARRATGLSVQEPDLLGDAVADALARRLVADVGAIGLPAERAARAALPAVNDVVIQGQFVRIDEGSQTRRLLLGFGVSGTELRTQVEIFQVTAAGWRPIQQFDTVATGSRLPAMGPVLAAGAVAGNVVGSATGTSAPGVLGDDLRVSIDADARRTSEQISKRLSELSSAQRW